jgi:hypothetical protein
MAKLLLIVLSIVGYALPVITGNPAARHSTEFVTKIPDEVISNLSIEISVLKAIWLSKNRPDSCPRRRGFGGSLGRYRVEFCDNNPAGATPFRKRRKNEESEHIELARRRNSRAFNNITRRK